MQTATDLMLIIEPDAESQAVLCTVGERLGCEQIETTSTEALNEVLAVRLPTIAVLAVDHIDTDICEVLEALANHDARPATLLVGSVSERLLASARRTAESRGLPVVGVAVRPLDGVSIERLLSPYLSVAPPIQLEELDQALTERELTLQYQPKLAIAVGPPSIQGVEALVRWQHPRRGLLQPLHFLGAFEKHGLMSRLTDFVMTEAVRQAGQWHERGLVLDMVVNLSPKLVRDRAFPERVATLLRESEFPAKHLVLDVTESPNIADRDLIHDVFTRLRILGVGLSLDNFGTGLSSLTELYRMPFSEIKVDHSLIADVPREREARLIVEGIAAIAKKLQLAICAEGVETRQVFDFVRGAGFDTAQGRFFSKPVQASEIERIVGEWLKSGPAVTGSWQVMKSPDFDATATNRVLPLSTARARNPK